MDLTCAAALLESNESSNMLHDLSKVGVGTDGHRFESGYAIAVSLGG
jgi:hypothetical protein